MPSRRTSAACSTTSLARTTRSSCASRISSPRWRTVGVTCVLLWTTTTKAPGSHAASIWSGHPGASDCRLLSGLTAYQLGEWNSVAGRLGLASKLIPQAQLGRSSRPPVSPFRWAAESRFRPVALSALREWWYVDGMIIVLTVMPGIDLLGDAGDLAGTLELHLRGSAGARQGLGQVSRQRADGRATGRTGGHTGSPCRRRAARARRPDSGTRRPAPTSLIAKVVRKSKGADWDPTDLDVLRDSSTETWAWGAKRLEAERLRLAWTLGQEPPPADDMVRAWRATVEGFDRLGHVFRQPGLEPGLARSPSCRWVRRRVCGWSADAARAVGAVRLRARPLLAELDALSPRAAPGGAAVELRLPVSWRSSPSSPAACHQRPRSESSFYISTKTVSVHVSNLLAKLGAPGRTEAAAIAPRDRALLPYPPSRGIGHFAPSNSGFTAHDGQSEQTLMGRLRTNSPQEHSGGRRPGTKPVPYREGAMPAIAEPYRIKMVEPITLTTRDPARGGHPGSGLQHVPAPQRRRLHRPADRLGHVGDE